MRETLRRCYHARLRKIRGPGCLGIRGTLLARTRTTSVKARALTDVARRSGTAPLNRVGKVKLPHFEAVGGVPGRDDAGATHRAADTCLDILTREGHTLLRSLSACTCVVRVCIRTGHAEGAESWWAAAVLASLRAGAAPQLSEAYRCSICRTASSSSRNPGRLLAIHWRRSDKVLGRGERVTG